MQGEISNALPCLESPQSLSLSEERCEAHECIWPKSDIRLSAPALRIDEARISKHVEVMGEGAWRAWNLALYVAESHSVRFGCVTFTRSGVVS